MHSKPVMNPTGGAVPRREVTKPALDTLLLEQVVYPDNMRRAWKRVKANKGAPGIDRMTLDEADLWLRTNWDTLGESVLDGSYQPLPLRRKAIPKASGGERLLRIP